MKILFLQPKMNKRPMDTNLKTQMSPPLSLLTLISLTSSEHEVILLNENVEDINFEIQVDLVAITVTLDVMPRACMISEKFKNNNIPVVAGGIHITCCPEDCKGYFDAICIGPAERVWGNILKDAELRTLKSVYCNMENFKGEEICSPYNRKINGKHYLYNNVVNTSRGCPNLCSFCYNSSENRMYVRRPIKGVIDEILSLESKHIFFIDDNFIGNPTYTENLLIELHKLKISWSAAVTTKILDHLALLDLMKESGCKSLFIGFESINDSSLQSVNKDNSVEKYERLVREIHNREIMINASMVFGLDGDDNGTFKRTLDWLVKMKIETLTSHILTPYPGTKLYENMKNLQRIDNFNLENYNTSHVVFKPLGMTKDELYFGYLWMYKNFYSLKNIFKRIPDNKKQIKSYLLFNLFYRKFGFIISALSNIIPMRFLGKLAAWIAYKVSIK